MQLNIDLPKRCEVFLASLQTDEDRKFCEPLLQTVITEINECEPTTYGETATKIVRILDNCKSKNYAFDDETYTVYELDNFIHDLRMACLREIARQCIFETK